MSHVNKKIIITKHLIWFFAAECTRRIVAIEGAIKAICSRLLTVDPNNRTSKDLAEQCIKVSFWASVDVRELKFIAVLHICLTLLPIFVDRCWSWYAPGKQVPFGKVVAFLQCYTSLHIMVHLCTRTLCIQLWQWFQGMLLITSWYCCWYCSYFNSLHTCKQTMQDWFFVNTGETPNLVMIET